MRLTMKTRNELTEEVSTHYKKKIYDDKALKYIILF